MRFGVQTLHEKQIITVLIGFLLAACGGEEEPTPLLQADAYFHFEDGKRLCFARDDGATEHWETLLYAETEEMRQYRVEASVDGFGVQERTFQFEVTADGLFLSSWNDCQTRCLTPSEPLKILGHPVYDRDRFEHETLVESVAGTQTESNVETHVFYVGAAKDLETPSGAKSGHEVTWTRTRNDEIWSNTLSFVGGTGFVGWTDDSGIVLEATTCAD